MNNSEVLYEYHCKRCGKIMFPTPDHAYKDERGMYCSWTCFNHRNDGRRRGHNNKQIEQYSLEGELLHVYPSATAAADSIYDNDATAQGIYKACRENKKYKRFIWRYKDET